MSTTFTMDIAAIEAFNAQMASFAGSAVAPTVTVPTWATDMWAAPVTPTVFESAPTGADVVYYQGPAISADEIDSFDFTGATLGELPTTNFSSFEVETIDDAIEAHGISDVLFGATEGNEAPSGLEAILSEAQIEYVEAEVMKYVEITGASEEAAIDFALQIVETMADVSGIIA